MENQSSLDASPENQKNVPESNKQKQEECKIIQIKRYKLCELAAIYEVNRKTFRGWVNKFKNEIGSKDGHYYSISQVKIILRKLELPSYVKIYPENSN